MKKIILISILSLFTIIAFSQTKEVSRIYIHSVGTEKIIDGKCKISFDKLMRNDKYFVMLTPIDTYDELYITDKKNNSFIVKSKSLSNISFDYIVFLKRTKQILRSQSSDKKIIDSNNKK